MNHTLTEQFPASIEAIETINANTNKFAEIISETVFLVKTTVALTSTLLLVASAWV